MPKVQKKEQEEYRCSFCNKKQSEVKKLIAGPIVFICDECVLICYDILVKDDVLQPGLYKLAQAVDDQGNIDAPTLAKMLGEFEEGAPVSALISRLQATLMEKLGMARQAKKEELEEEIDRLRAVLKEAESARVNLPKLESSLRELERPEPSEPTRERAASGVAGPMAELE